MILTSMRISLTYISAAKNCVILRKYLTLLHRAAQDNYLKFMNYQ